MDIKSFFYEWCAKMRVEPTFEVISAGVPHNQRFVCQLRVGSYPYRATGSSSTKKESERCASRDFINYLVRTDVLKQEDIPEETTPKAVNDSLNRQDQLDVNWMETESVEEDAAANGFWTIATAKSKLHQFMNMNGCVANYVYTALGPEHSRRFTAELNMNVKKSEVVLSARASGMTKLAASKKCALVMVRHLYQLGIIEAYNGTLKQNTDDLIITPYPVDLPGPIVDEIRQVVYELNLPMVDTSLAMTLCKENPISLLANAVQDVKAEWSDMKAERRKGSPIRWAPPQPNWNVWNSCSMNADTSWSSSLPKISNKLSELAKHRESPNLVLQRLSEFLKQLPISSMRRDITNAIRNNSVVIVHGNNGCGKTTQIAQYILEDYIASYQGAYCNIYVTQPYRLSAISAAKRVAYERCELLGESVGYSVRCDTVTPRPYGAILFCTVGVLLRKLENGLCGVSHIIVDEIHERDVNTDFLLVVLRDMVNAYPNLRVVLMSATVNTSMFVKYFNNCPVVNVPDKSHTVQQLFLEDCIEVTKYIPSADSKHRDEDEDNFSHVTDDNVGTVNLNTICGDQYSPQTKMYMAMMSESKCSFELIEHLLRFIVSQNLDGGVLIFLPSWKLIYDLIKYLQNSDFGGSDYCILPCHSQIPKEDERRIFAPVQCGVRKIILSTNIAETSITIDDIAFVIDSCKVRIKMFTSHNNLTSYTNVWASKSNLEERKRRAGRLKPGFCFTLCSRARFMALNTDLTPEILRTPLHELALMIKLLKLGPVGEFLCKAIQPPPMQSVIEAEKLLRDIRCVDSNDELLPLGRILARLPIEPKLGKMLILSTAFECADLVAGMAANSGNMSEMFICDAGLYSQQKDLRGDKHSDHVAMIVANTLWQNALESSEDEGRSFCESKGLRLSTMWIAAEAKKQLLDLLLFNGFPCESMIGEPIGFKSNSPRLSMATGLLCMGLYPNVCYHKERRAVITTELMHALIHKTSVNCSSSEITFPYPYFVFDEKILSNVVSCKGLTMVTPIHLLLFGCRKIDLISPSVVRLDDWLTLLIEAEQAAMLAALKLAIENLVTLACERPSDILQLDKPNTRLVNVIKELCAFNFRYPNHDRDDNDESNSTQPIVPCKTECSTTPSGTPSNSQRNRQRFRQKRTVRFAPHFPHRYNRSAGRRRGAMFGQQRPDSFRQYRNGRKGVASAICRNARKGYGRGH